MTVSKEGAAIGTTYLAIASPENGKMSILSDLAPNDDETRTRLGNAIRHLAGPNRPMHLVEVKVVSRVLTMDEATIAPPVHDIEHRAE